MNQQTLDDDFDRDNFNRVMTEIADNVTRTIIDATTVDHATALSQFPAESIIYTANGYARLLDQIRSNGNGSVIASALISLRRKLIIQLGLNVIRAVSNEFNHGDLKAANISLWSIAFPGEPKLTEDESIDRICCYLYLVYLKDIIIKILNETISKRK